MPTDAKGIPMRTSFRALMVTLAIAGAALAVPAFASAETLCVNAGAACPAGGQELAACRMP